MTDLKQYTIKAASARELVSAIEADVASGTLQPGQGLPSVRRLAAGAGLSPATVAAGLAELRRRGVLVSEPRRGIRVGDGPPIGSMRPVMPVPAGTRDLSRGNPDPQLLPDLGLALAGTELPRRLYGEPAALPQLAAIARRQLRLDGIPAESVCVVSGALDGIERVLGAHLRPGDRVAVENPGYAALFDLLRARGLTLEPVDVDECGMQPAELQAALARGASAVVITPRGQNPTGASLDRARAAELRKLLRRHPQALVIEDDHLGALAGRELHSTVKGSERWAATRSVAKALGPDLRLAILAGDAQTVARVEGQQQCGPGWVSHILQRLVVQLLGDAAVRVQVQGAARAYARRREGLRRRLHDLGVASMGRSGLNVWIPAGEESAVVAALMQRGWAVAAGAPYRLGGSSPAIRVTTATLAPEEAARLANDIAGVLARPRSSRTG